MKKGILIIILFIAGCNKEDYLYKTGDIMHTHRECKTMKKFTEKGIYTERIPKKSIWQYAIHCCPTCVSDKEYAEIVKNIIEYNKSIGNRYRYFKYDDGLLQAVKESDTQNFKRDPTPEYITVKYKSTGYSHKIQKDFYDNASDDYKGLYPNHFKQANG
jgi:hypothetical protein